jgi:hypothetical protein
VAHGTDQGLRARERPSLELFSMALVSTSAEMVKRDLGRHSCWMSADALPALSKRAFTAVSGSSACCVPNVSVFSPLENECVSSAPTAVLVSGLTRW